MPRPLNNPETALNAQNLLALPAEFGCPVWVYDAEIIRQQIAQLRQFDVIRFAQKACSNIHILRLMREQGVKVDSVSQGEIERALAAGYQPLENKDDIVFTADMIDQPVCCESAGSHGTHEDDVSQCHQLRRCQYDGLKVNSAPVEHGAFAGHAAKTDNPQAK